MTELRISSVASYSLFTTRWATVSMFWPTCPPMLVITMRLTSGSVARPALTAHQSSRRSRIFWF